MDLSLLSIPAALLRELTERYSHEGSVLVMGDAALANALNPRSTALVWDVRERDRVTGEVAGNDPLNGFDAVALPAPPNRELLRRLILIGANALRPGGKLYIAGANAEGGKTAVKDAEQVLGPANWSGYREKHRMAILQRRTLLSPGWADQPGIAPGTWQAFSADTPVGELTLHTQAGVFAGGKIDAGTQLLLETLHIEPGTRVLDIGCGAGVIGIVAAKLGASVTMTDANLLAVKAAAHNVEKLALTVNVVASDVYSHLGDETFDLIVSNPPFHRGKEVDLTVVNEIISGAAARLNPGGSLVLVANTFLAYGKEMAKVFTRVDSIATTPQYHVLRGKLTP